LFPSAPPATGIPVFGSATEGSSDPQPVRVRYRYGTDRKELSLLCHKESSVVDPDPGSGAFLIPGSGMGKKSKSGSWMNVLNHISKSLETMFWVKFFDADADPGIKKTLDTEKKN
jgi:hypothetical protein